MPPETALSGAFDELPQGIARRRTFSSRISGNQGVVLGAGNRVEIIEGRSTSRVGASVDRSTSGPIVDPILSKNGSKGSGLELGNGGCGQVGDQHGDQ